MASEMSKNLKVSSEEVTSHQCDPSISEGEEHAAPLAIINPRVYTGQIVALVV